MLKLICCIFATALLFAPFTTKAETSIVAITLCGKPLYVFSVSDVDGGGKTARFGAYSTIKGNAESWALMLRMLDDPNLNFKKWAIEEEAGLTCA